MKKLYSVAVVGATGLIGRRFLKVLEKRNFPIGRLKVFASSKSRGIRLNACGREIAVETLDENCFNGIDIAVFSAGKEVSLKYAPIAAKSGCLVIDNSSAFRRETGVPLVIPEINMETALNYSGKIISNPNCSTVQAILPLAKLYEEFSLKRLIITTYQAVSGSGQKGVNDLTRGTIGKPPLFYPVDISKNCICRIGELLENSYTDEEMKASFETQKIFGKKVSVSATCVRVPIENCHSVSVEAEFEKDIDLNDAIARIYSTEGVKLKNLPHSTYSDGKEEVFVGRIRKSLAFERGIAYFCVADNTLKGAALNAVQIAERMIKAGKI
ncbi:MAG: aspartate-semialdehyde dehydrogenase [Clostridia bacterium]|nr:aspartate-semialdehyde dehydrogenase [Clostridia bacterium]